MIQDFEQALVGGKAHWIKSFVHEPAVSRLSVWFTDNVDSPDPTRQLEFLDIEHLDITWSAQDDSCLEGLLGAYEDELSGLVRYVLVTEQREITVITRRKAVIHGER